MTAAFLVGLGITPTLAGQVQTREISGSPTSPETADLAITATVKADSLRFNKKGDSQINFSGTQGRETGWITERENIPKRAEEGVTYRDVTVNLQITSVFSNIDEILSEAFNEELLPANSTPKP